MKYYKTQDVIGGKYYEFEPETEVCHIEVHMEMVDFNMGMGVGIHKEVNKRRFGGEGYFERNIIQDPHTKEITKEEFYAVLEAAEQVLKILKPFRK